MSEKTIQQIRDEGKRIHDAALDALARAGLGRDDNESLAAAPVNWSDIRVAAVEFIIPASPPEEDAHYRVTLSEAAPEAYALSGYVGDRLKLLAVDENPIAEYIEVVTEW